MRLALNCSKAKSKDLPGHSKRARATQLMTYFVYMMTNGNREVLYIGMTNDLERRVAEHKTHMLSGFTDKYNVETLVYFESYDDPTTAIAREKQLKGWTRKKKDALIEKTNPLWKDLSIQF